MIVIFIGMMFPVCFFSIYNKKLHKMMDDYNLDGAPNTIHLGQVVFASVILNSFLAIWFYFTSLLKTASQEIADDIKVSDH